MEELGSGFFLAMHDLEIRGAGEVLGENQSGEMLEIGFQLYSDMLSEAVRSLKAGKEPDLAAPLSSTTEINLHVPALLPSGFCGDVHERLSIYKRLANCNSGEKVDDMQEELIDRFGALPPEVKNLLEVIAIKRLCKAAGVDRIEVGPKGAIVGLRGNRFARPDRLVAYIARQGDRMKVRSDHRLVYLRRWDDAGERLAGVSRILGDLAGLAA
jgi:transcription-repair coupling factor (superfamily II helicase)